MRLLRLGQSLPASQTPGSARGVVRLEAGKRPLQHFKTDREPTTSDIGNRKPRNIKLCSPPPSNQTPAQGLPRQHFPKKSLRGKATYFLLTTTTFPMIHSSAKVAGMG